MFIKTIYQEKKKYAMIKKLIYEANEPNYDYSKTTYERDGWGLTFSLISDELA